MNRTRRILAFALVMLASASGVGAKDKYVICDTRRAVMVKGPGGKYGLWEYLCAPQGSWNPSPEQCWHETSVYAGPLRFSVPCSFPVAASGAVALPVLLATGILLFLRRGTSHRSPFPGYGQTRHMHSTRR